MQLIEKTSGYLKIAHDCGYAFYQFQILLFSVVILGIDALFLFLFISDFTSYSLTQVIAFILTILVTTLFLIFLFFLVRVPVKETWRFSDKLVITYLVKRRFGRVKRINKVYALKNIVAVKCKQSLPMSSQSGGDLTTSIFLSISLSVGKKIGILITGDNKNIIFNEVCQITDEIENVLNYWGCSVKIEKNKRALFLR